MCSLQELQKLGMADLNTIDCDVLQQRPVSGPSPHGAAHWAQVHTALRDIAWVNLQKNRHWQTSRSLNGPRRASTKTCSLRRGSYWTCTQGNTITVDLHQARDPDFETTLPVGHCLPVLSVGRPTAGGPARADPPRQYSDSETWLVTGSGQVH